MAGSEGLKVTRRVARLTANRSRSLIELRTPGFAAVTESRFGSAPAG